MAGLSPPEFESDDHGFGRADPHSPSGHAQQGGAQLVDEAAAQSGSGAGDGDPTGSGDLQGDPKGAASFQVTCHTGVAVEPGGDDSLEQCPVGGGDVFE